MGYSQECLRTPQRSSSSSFYLPNNTTVYTFAWIRFRRAGQQGPIRTLTAALKCSIKKQSLGAYTITQIKLLQTRKTRKISLFNAIPKKHLKMQNL